MDRGLGFSVVPIFDEPASTVVYKTQRYFDKLAELGLWSGNIANTIALLYIYMPIIRKEIYNLNYVGLWNAHIIRPQKIRPGIVPGKPVDLHFNPPPSSSEGHGEPETEQPEGRSVHDYGSPVPQEKLQHLKHMVSTLVCILVQTTASYYVI